jgi:hypothetical protein
LRRGSVALKVGADGLQIVAQLEQAVRHVRNEALTRRE